MKRRNLKEYRIWQGMKSRCYAPSQTKGCYKKKGIQVCERWRYSFENFIEDMGAIPGDDYSIERIDNDGDYCPENCKWIPQRQQQKNRSNLPMYEYQGKRMCLKEWSRELGFSYDRIRGRLRRGVPFEEAINEALFDRTVVLNGEARLVSEWCRELGLNEGDVYSRINRGWSREEALTRDTERIRK